MNKHKLVPIPTNYRNLKKAMEEDETMYKYYGFHSKKQVKELSLEEFTEKVRYDR